MKLLSFSINFHDSSIAFYDGKKISYYKHERASQVKHASILSIEQVIGLLKENWGLSFEDFDAISAYLEYPGAEILDKTYIINPKYVLANGTFFNNGVDFIQQVEINKKILEKYNIERVDHHLCHYLSAKFLTNRKIDYGFVLDGEGEPNVCGSVYRNNKCIFNIHSDSHGSLGAFVEKFAVECGIEVALHIDGPGKLMSFQSYGEIEPKLFKSLSNFNILNLNDISDFIFNENIIEKFPKKNVARTVHTFLGLCIVDFFKSYASTDDTIIYSGGVAQNIVWNTQLRKSFPNIIIPPYSSDEGLSLGALRYLMEKYECI